MSPNELPLRLRCSSVISRWRTVNLFSFLNWMYLFLYDVRLIAGLVLAPTAGNHSAVREHFAGHNVLQATDIVQATRRWTDSSDRRRTRRGSHTVKGKYWNRGGCFFYHLGRVYIFFAGAKHGRNDISVPTRTLFGVFREMLGSFFGVYRLLFV